MVPATENVTAGTMPDDTQMTIAERRKYLGLMRGRDLLANRVERSYLLDEMHAVTGLHRKSLLRLLNGPHRARRPRTQQRGKTYDPHVDDAIRVIWESWDSI